MKNCLVLFFAIATLTSCTYEKAELEPVPTDTTIVVICDTAAITYTNDIKPIITASCGVDNSSCHQDENSTSEIPLITYDDVKIQIEFGPLLSSIAQDGTSEPMPQNADKLDDCSINKIKAWVNQGMPE